MRVLNVIERRSIAGGGDSTPGPGVAGAFTQNSPTFFTNNGNGFQVTVACTNPTNFGFTLGLSTSGKLVNFTTGATLTLPADCTITTINTRTGIEQVCNDGVCHT